MQKRALSALVMLALFVSCALGQAVNMPTYGYADTTGTHFVVYDDGGPSGNHSPSSAGVYTFRTSTPGARWKVLVHSTLHTTSTYIAHLRIYAGDSSSVNSYYSYGIFESTAWPTTGGGYTGSEYQCNALYYCPDSVLTIAFNCDDDNPMKGFKIELCEVGCYDERATYVSYGLVDTSADETKGTLRLSWSQQSTATNWMVVYYCHQNMEYSSYTNHEWGGAVTHDTIAFDTLYTDTNFVDIPNYPVGWYVVYDIKPVSDGLCGGYGILGVLSQSIVHYVPCECIAPRGTNSQFVGDSVYFSWLQDTNVEYWSIYSSGYVNMDTVVTGNSLVLYWPDSVRCMDMYIAITGNCDIHSACSYNTISAGRYNCSQIGSHYGYLYYRGGWSYDYPTMSLLSQGPHSLVVGWQETDKTTAYEVTCWRATYPYDVVSVDTIGPHVAWDTITGLDEATAYNILVRSLCADGYRSCSSYSQSFVTTVDGCIDYINLTDSVNVHLTRGTYSEPTYYNDSAYHYFYYPLLDTTVNYFYQDYGFRLYYFYNDGRHTVIYDTLGHDAHTGYQLKLVPTGKKASMKLGDDDIGAQAETITYDYYVDSNVYDLLMVQYALVMQNPNHTLENQPHFTLEILDSAGHLIDSSCSYVDFYAADNLEGWSSVAGTNIIWKDWTTVGIDIAPYHGQNIKIRFTNKDCAEGGHYAYAYFTMHCDNKRICIYNYCDAVDSIHMRVPQGFEYQWTRNGDSIVLGTDYDITVPVDNTTVYFCRCNLMGKPDCYFTMQSYAIGVFPRAELHAWVDTCKQTAYVVNDAHVEYDTTYPVCVPQDVSNVHWRVDDGTLQYGDTLVIPFPENRLYTVWLVAELSESWCRDSTSITFPVDYAYRRSITGDTSVCLGDTVSLTAHIWPPEGLAFSWSTGAADSGMTVVPGLYDTLYAISYDNGHCADTLYRKVAVHPVYDDTIHHEACNGYVFDSLGFHQSTTGLYTLSLSSMYGCDSLSTLDLLIHPTYDLSFVVEVCDTVCDTLGFHGDTSGLYSKAVTTAVYGCDSMVSLTLRLYPDYDLNDTLVICPYARYLYMGVDYGGPSTFDTVLPTVHGCDSLVHVTLSRFDMLLAKSEDNALWLPIDTLLLGCEPYGLYLWDTTPGIVDRRWRVFGDTVSVVDSVGLLRLELPPGSYDLVYDCLSVDGCRDTMHVKEIAVVYPNPVAQFGWVDTFPSNLDPQVAFVNRSEPSGLLTYLWRISGMGGHDTSTLVNPGYSWGDPYTDTQGEYDVTLTAYWQHWYDTVNSIVCPDSVTIPVAITNVYLQFPNLVTPNGDGQNDHWEVVNLTEYGNYAMNEVWIYDRWGVLVWHRKDMREGSDRWDPNETRSPDGTYYFRFAAAGQYGIVKRNGVIEVLRR